ncbi:MAG: hypothetical protein MN733_43435 [Nitrososphaera sp.]|nr:hypothetical protein [Nitrososphaera sp.]
MTYGVLKDIVREHFGRIGWPSAMLDQALAQARRDIEKNGNYYWMRDSATFNTTDGDNTEAITSGNINEAAFKDIIALGIKETTEFIYTPVDVGNISLEEAEMVFSVGDTTDEDMPRVAVIENVTLHLFPTPDDTYNMKMWFYAWTDNQSNLESDELSNRFPDALIYGALAVGAEMFEKNMQAGAQWRAMFRAELDKIHRHNFERELMDRSTLEPMVGMYKRMGFAPRHNPYSWI